MVDKQNPNKNDLHGENLLPFDILPRRSSSFGRMGGFRRHQFEVLRLQYRLLEAQNRLLKEENKMLWDAIPDAEVIGREIART